MFNDDDEREFNALTEFANLNEQSDGEIKTSMESLGWTFNEKVIVESDLATRDNFNSSSRRFVIDLYKTANKLNLKF